MAVRSSILNEIHTADHGTVTGAAELAGQVALGKGLTSQFRPRKYFTIPKASLERLLDDVEQFINFFVIESQRIVFAENVYTTIAVSRIPSYHNSRRVQD